MITKVFLLDIFLYFLHIILNIILTGILTNETTRALFRVFYTKCARHMRFFAVTLNRYILLFVEFFVGSANVLLVRISVGAALVTAYRFSTYTFQNNIIALIAYSI